MDTSVQARLRAASHALHVRINRHPMLVGLTRPDYPLSTYQAVLAAYSRLYASIESRIEQFIAAETVPFDYRNKYKAPWLKQDLDFLGLEQADLHRSAPVFPPITDIGQLIGVLYPIEGSTLGGQVISGHLLQNLGFSSERGARFFSGYGELTERRWREFCNFAETIRDDTALYRRAEAATIFTFLRFEEVLDECGQQPD